MSVIFLGMDKMEFQDCFVRAFFYTVNTIILKYTKMHPEYLNTIT